MKLITICISALLFAFFLSLPLDAGAQTPPPYQPLAPLPGIDSSMGVANYFSTIYQIGISIVLVIAVVMLVYGGIQYMTSDSIGGKGNGRETVAKAIIGIVLAVTSYALLYVIGGSGSVSVGFDIPDVGFVEAPPPFEGDETTQGSPLACYAARIRSASSDEKKFYCGTDVENIKRILFKLPFPGESNESYDEPGACYLVEEVDVMDIANEECLRAGGEIEERPYLTMSRDYLYGHYCLIDATEQECASILEGEFVGLEGMADTMWDQSFCDARSVPTEGTTPEQRAEFDALYRQFLNELLVGNSYQTSGYYFDENYKTVAGDGTHWHTGIDIGTGGQTSSVKSPVSGTFYVLREPGFNGYDDNGKFAIVEGGFGGTPKVWVFTHVDGFLFDHGQTVHKGDLLASVGERPCFPLVGGGFQCDMGAHLDLNIYTDTDMISWPNDPNNWSESNMTSGRHPNQTTIASKTMCPFQAYWESINGAI
jgi:hypothetical protein